ncbi:ATP-binding protein [Hyphomicrobiales bacterium BP6-180914]|uniref:histidine kinase n=1 Tax=Lichenifustis flavocetrariae TaxID=2949735 RepID=A0AA41Z2T4_9HYPH|nr:ATP-binding protein [Lichenifustis flavocetrariae]
MPAIGGESALLMVSGASIRLHGAATHVEACHIAAEEVRRIAKLDGVMIYQFASDWSGEVIAEARDAAMPSYLGLHFPASDIPVQARRLYRSNPIRMIVSVDYEPSPLIHPPSAIGTAPIDLSFSILRSVSPIHLEYLRNMGVGASMSVSVLRDGELWGLIACHHRTAKHVGYELRQACELVARFLAAQMEALDKLARAGRKAKVEELRAQLADEIASGHTVAQAIERQGDRLLQLPSAIGFAMVLPDAVARVGHCPEQSIMNGLSSWLASRQDDAVFQTDRIGELYEPAASHAETFSGLMAVPLARPHESHLIWCRPEQAQTVQWAGNPAKPVDQRADASQLYPRQSFKAWTEEMRGRSLPWSVQDVSAAEQLRDIVLDLMLREKDDLTRQNLRLIHSMHELETFLYVASHDINEPLRQMEMLMSLARRCVAPHQAEEAAEYFQDFGTLSKHLRSLVTSLADFARLGRSEVNFGPVDLAELLRAVVQQLEQRIVLANAAIVIGDLPQVHGERDQLHQVFVNLLGNALKYRDLERPIQISVTSEPVRSTRASEQGAAAGMVSIVVRDNGIGFDPQFSDRIFKPFERLHPRERYEGSGLGLSICRRIVERHGGRIEARGELGQGAQFRLRLKTEPAPRALLEPRDPNAASP